MDERKRILFICGSLNQTTQLHAVANELGECEQRFTPFYGTGMTHVGVLIGLAETTIAGTKRAAWCFDYLRDHGLSIDYRGREGSYDLVVTCSDVILPRNIWNTKVVLCQEGAVDPDGWEYRWVKRLPFVPRWLAGTGMTGMSHTYDTFCVASEGFRDFFVERGIDRAKLAVTGIPNFDDCKRFYNNTFPHKGYVLVCTSDLRETAHADDRTELVKRALRIAAGRALLFKLHPNEHVERATQEIKSLAPHALIFSTGSAEEMIANCDVLITRWSSVVYVGFALGKEVFTSFNVDEVRRLTPNQNGGTSARNIANVCRELLRMDVPPPRLSDGPMKASPLSYLRIDL